MVTIEYPLQIIELKHNPLQYLERTHTPGGHFSASLRTGNNFPVREGPERTSSPHGSHDTKQTSHQNPSGNLYSNLPHLVNNTCENGDHAHINAEAMPTHFCTLGYIINLMSLVESFCCDLNESGHTLLTQSNLLTYSTKCHMTVT